MIGKKAITSLAVGATMLTGAATVDVVPREAPMLQAYQYKVSEFQKTVTVTTATGTQTIVNDQPEYKDTNRDGLISVKMSYDKFGKRVYEQIDEVTYANMGKKGGAVYNTPVKYSITLAEAALEAAITEAEAAVAYDARIDIWYFVGTSGTFAHTTSGTDRILFVSANNEGGPDDITGVTYAGVSLTEIGTRVQQGSSGRYTRSFCLVAPSTGTNNVVISRSSSNQTNYVGASYNGANQSCVMASSSQQFASPIGSATLSLTTTEDNSWLVGNSFGGRTVSAGSGTTLRTSASIDAWYDSNGAKSPAGSYSLVFTQSPDNTPVAAQIFAIPPVSSGGGATVSPIIQPQIMWW